MSSVPTFLVVHSQYQHVTLALTKADIILEQRMLHKHDASSQLIVSIDELLTNNRLSLTDCDALVAHAGPGPFTTLRVILATINGLGFSTHIPLIGINGLSALGSAYANAIILLNAFCNDVYFAIVRDGLVQESGVAAITDLLPYIRPLITEHTKLIGNGIQLHQEQIVRTLGDAANIPQELPLEASIEQIATLGYRAWQQQQTVAQITPLYLKAYSAHMSV